MVVDVKSQLSLILLLVLALSGCSTKSEARYLQRGSEFLNKKDYARALIEFNNAAYVAPKSAEPYYRLGLTYAAMNDKMLAAASYKRATDLNPKHREAQMKLSELLAESQERELQQDAEFRLRTLLEKTPDSASVLMILATSEWNQGKKLAAEQHLNQAFRLHPEFNTAVRLARIRLDNKDPLGAEAILQKAIDQVPNDADLRVAMGELHSIQGKFAEAEQTWKQALQMNPKSTAALKDLGALYVTQSKMGEAEAMYRRLSELPDKQYASSLAVFLLQSGQSDRAIQEFERLWKKSPGDRARRTELIGAYLQLNREKEAEALLSQALKKNTSDVDAIFQMGILKLRRGQRKEALAAFYQALSYYPDSGEVHYLVAQAHRALGSLTSYQRELDQAIRLKPELINARLELCARLLAVQAVAGALQLIEGTPPAQKSLMPVVVQRNWVLFAAGRKEEMRQQVDLALRRERNPDLLMQDATLRFGDHDYAGTQRTLEELLQTTPDNLAALTLLVTTHSLQGRAGKTLEVVQGIANRFPQAAAPQYLLGEMLLTKGRIEEAREAFARAWTEQKQYLPAALALSNIEIQKGRLYIARKTLEEALAVNPSNAEAMLMLGSVHEREQRYLDAVRLYRSLVELDGSNVQALNNLAYLLAERLNQADDALQYADKAEELAPHNGMIKDTIGWVLFRKGLYPQAVERLKEAVSIEATPVRQAHLAMAYYKAGEPKRGKELLEAVLARDPGLPEVAEAVEMMKR